MTMKPTTELDSWVWQEYVLCSKQKGIKKYLHKRYRGQIKRETDKENVKISMEKND